MNGRPWTRAEDEALESGAADGMSARAVAEKLGRTEDGVCHRAKALRVSFHSRRRKTDDERVRERWAAMLPAMKEALRRDIEINI